MQLKDIPELLNVQLEGIWDSARDLTIRGVTHNSKWVKNNFIFVAIRGQNQDAHIFLPEALNNGAIAVVGEGFGGASELSVPYIVVPNARAALAEIAAILNGNPSQRLTIVGVTGTKGKTTTTWLTHHLLKSAGFATGLLSTVGFKLADDNLQQFPDHFTTPEAPEIQVTLSEMVGTGCTHAVIEASSHALALLRLYKTKFDVAVWTNLAPEHLDFHKDMEGYFAAKRKLVDSASFAVLNADDEWSVRLLDHPNVTYAIHSPATWRARDIIEREKSLHFTVDYPQGSFPVILPMLGDYNIYNTLAAMAAAFHLGVGKDDLQTALQSFGGVPGRMEIIQEFPQRVIVDFAHTPESLEKALKTLRKTTKRELIVVIGSAGNRYPGKRAPLGFVATQLADKAIFTEEDSRYTPIEDILGEMKTGAEEGGKHNFLLIPNRYEAIYHAIAESLAGDTIVLAGKGTEPTLERAKEVIPWDEACIARQILKEINGRS